MGFVVLIFTWFICYRYCVWYASYQSWGSRQWD